MTALQEAVEELMGTIDSLELALERCIPRKPLTDQQKLDLVTNWFAEDWAIKKALGLLHDYDIKQAQGIGGEE